MSDTPSIRHGRVLIVEDDFDLRGFVARGLEALGYQTMSTETADEALVLIARDAPEVVITDLRLGPSIDGLELCKRALELSPHLPFIVMTGYGNMETAIGAIRAGAYDFINKPIDFVKLDLILTRALKHRRLLDEVSLLREQDGADRGTFGMIGESPPMRRMFDMIHRLRESDATVLISGESGTGKELVARALHSSNARASGPFVAINCAAVPAPLLESELFGHVRGAFTDARRARDGLLTRANGGTILLDEIGEFPLEVQPKLLRALQERRVRPVGSNREIPIDVRVLAATNRDLESMVEQQLFREDLYYRINVIELRVPPLRARGRDVLTLAQHMIDEMRAREGKAVRGLSAAAAACIVRYSWPGNVRELENAIERAFALARYDEIDVMNLPTRMRTTPKANEPTSPTPAEPWSLDAAERRHIEETLYMVAGNKTRAAELLGISRRALYRKLERFGIKTVGGLHVVTPARGVPTYKPSGDASDA